MGFSYAGIGDSLATRDAAYRERDDFSSYLEREKRTSRGKIAFLSKP